MPGKGVKNMKKIVFVDESIEESKKKGIYGEDFKCKETNLTKENVLDDFNKLEMKYKEFIHRSYIEGKSEQSMMAYFDMTIAVHKEGIYVRDLIDINKNKKNKSERKSILDEINKSHSEVRLNNDIKLQNYYKNIIEKVS